MITAVPAIAELGWPLPPPSFPHEFGRKEFGIMPATNGRKNLRPAGDLPLKIISTSSRCSAQVMRSEAPPHQGVVPYHLRQADLRGRPRPRRADYSRRGLGNRRVAVRRGPGDRREAGQTTGEVGEKRIRFVVTKRTPASTRRPASKCDWPHVCRP